MTNLLNPGKYVVAVSGGVDSVVLLHMLSKDKKLDLIVAHFDHGIRQDSAMDDAFVKSIAEELKLPYFSKRSELGQNASEAEARKWRYEFLKQVLKKTNSNAIVTAHHQDDLIETALHNVIRGTKRKGLVSLKNTDTVKRPLLSLTKKDLKDYAEKNNLKWREDNTNQDRRYTRNRLRAAIQEKITPGFRKNLKELLAEVENNNKNIDSIIDQYLATQDDGSLSKTDLINFSSELSKEIIAEWLRKNKTPFDKKTIERILEGTKKLQNNSQIDVQKNVYCLITKTKIVLKSR